MSHSQPGREWWRSAVVYQVYPRSFQDSDGDGIGDIPGIVSRLDYLHDLGVDVIWLSPVYRSPHDDNGYDISDYEDIDPTFGTLADIDELIAELHARGMKLVMDLVVNHTSDEHAWFVDSRSGRDAEHADWYMWRDPRPGAVGGRPGAEPNNWGSFFSGSAWEWEPARGQYYLHLFSRKQPDLNWENPVVRRAVYDMMNRWLDRGVDGFRMDVINFISKDLALPDGEVLSTGFGDGMPFFRSGPRLQEFLAEMKAEVFDGREQDYLTVGEMPDATPELAARLTDSRTGQLSMIFQFEHVGLDQIGGKWNVGELDLRDLKRSFARWQEALAEHGWNSLYWNNHDQPRIVSRWGNDREHWYASATALATVLHLQRGTPYVYQGEELGMTNVPFDDIGALRDIESINHYATAVDLLGHEPEDVLAALRAMGRDNARTPMQWTAEPGAGFTSATPWIGVNPNHERVNAAAQVGDPGSVWAHYRRLIALRHEDPVVVQGDFRMLLPDDPAVFAYTREAEGTRLLVVANLSDETVECDLAGDRLVLTNLPERAGVGGRLAPWEARIYRSTVA
ncbi:alpha-glucosidase [Microbacterium sp. NPDC064584]|uniref:glycoside hydrolase family 13 protein n=1 Tax=Microbacterium sp. NPDC064584 TaxID=3155817 RepID=UPI0034465643